jgi:predicted transposase/invertase (TIGR01784 family)
MSDVTNPHDRFFRKIFSQPDAMEDLVMQLLPPEVSGLLQANTFQLREGSFVDANLREHFSDLLYRVDFKDGSSGFVYILFEHKSTPASDVAWQILRYKMRIWEQEAQSTAESFPPVIPIIPIVLYHGSARWRIPPNFASLYRAPRSLEGLLDFTYQLIDLSAYSDLEVKLRAIPGVALLLMKHIYSEDLPDRLPEIFELLRALARDTALDFLQTLLRYASAAAPERITVEHLRRAVEAAFPERGENCMNKLIKELIKEYRPDFYQEVLTQGIERGIEQGIEQGIERGIEKGLQAGRAEGMREAAASLTIRQLKRKFGTIDASILERVQRLSLKELERLGEELLDFRNLSSLIDWLETVETSQ